MKDSIVLKTILFVSGLLGTGIGAAILFVPDLFHASSGIELGGNASLLSEIRAPGGALLASGILVMSGAFIDRLAFTSAVLSVLLYGSYGLSRIVSFSLDGMPHTVLVQATALEIAVAVICTIALVKYRDA